VPHQIHLHIHPPTYTKQLFNVSKDRNRGVSSYIENMKMTLRKGIALATLLFAAATCALAQAPAGPVQSPALPAQAPAPQNPAFVAMAAQYPVIDSVSDHAGVIDDDLRAQLTAAAKQIEAQHNVHINFVTVPTLNGLAPKSVSMAIANNWASQHNGHGRNIQILLDVAERQDRFEVCRNLESTISDAEAATILKDMVPMLREGEYGRALLSAAQSVSDLLTEKEKAAPAPNAPPSAPSQNPPPPQNPPPAQN
jgi:hypothetical protein